MTGEAKQDEMRPKRTLRDRIVERRPQIIVTLLVVLFVVVYLAPSIFISIHSGEAGVLYRRFLGGTLVDEVYGEGFHVIWPWDRMYVYNVRIQKAAREIEVLTRKGLKVRIDVAVRYHPEYELLGVLHQRLGPDYLEAVVLPEVESTLRRVVGTYDAEEIYQSQRAIVATLMNEAEQQTAERFIVIDDVMIRSITLPEKVQAAIEGKIEQQHLYLAYEFRLKKEEEEKKRKLIEAEGFRLYNDEIAKSLNESILKWEGIVATKELAASDNAKVVVIGNGADGLPIILGAEK